jgi:hypothetical protein
MDALLKKLNYKTGTIVVLNAPPEFRHTAEGWKDEFPLAEAFGSDPANFLLVFAKDSSEVASIVAPASRRLDLSAVFWVAFPKRNSPHYSSDIDRDKLWPMMAAMGFSPNRNVAIDEDWSALRFAPAAQDPGRWA